MTGRGPTTVNVRNKNGSFIKMVGEFGLNVALEACKLAVVLFVMGLKATAWLLRYVVWPGVVALSRAMGRVAARSAEASARKRSQGR